MAEDDKPFKAHGGYTIDRENAGRTEYWTCGHVTYFGKDSRPPLECPDCAKMTDEARREYFAKRQADFFTPDIA